MRTKEKLKWLLIIAVIGLALWKIYPPLDVHDKEGRVIKKGKINLGLDLQGGMHLVLEVDTSKLPPDVQKDPEAISDATDRALEIIRNRIDQFGVLEPSINRQGRDKIVVQLPGVTDRERAIELIGRTAHLEFKLVSDDVELLRKALAQEAVEGYEIKYSGKEPLLVAKVASLTGDTLTNAQVSFDQRSFGQPYVSLAFNPKGAAIFAQVTAANVNRRLAIVLDGDVQSAPVIREAIPSGQAQITGNFSVEQAGDLAIVLRAGALPAPIKITEERTVGPTLGHDSITKGINSVILGGVLVLGFMAVYYLFAGLVADLALIVNILLILGAMAYFRATLTLPGIAGLVLTIGMSVDANVLIYERIREELKLGKVLRAATDAGFKRAFLTILDSNLTTLIAALLLFQFGTGPVRGFATTLSIGIVTSMFTAVTVTKLILNLFIEEGMERMPMLQLLKNPNIDFIGMRKLAYILSLVVIIGGMAVFFMRGSKNYGIDFTGGTIQQYSFEKTISLDELRKALREIGEGDVPIQQYGVPREVILRTPSDTSDRIMDAFKNKFPDNPFELLRIEKVGPSVGEELKTKALWALFWATIGILIYVGFRFEFRYATTAVLALGHDVLVSVGLLSLTGREISTSVIAALLTLIGYSINDTIVIFDRIREDRKLMYKSDYKTIINTAINQTFTRSIITSFTTLLVVMALFFLGGEVINDFAFVLFVGVITGSYSTIFVASPLLIDWPGRKKLAVARKGR